MSIRKTLFTALSLLFFVSCLSAQNTNSPYSRYGMGTLETSSFGKSRAMGGIGYGIRDNRLINPQNPASYSAVDTLNFVFDFGVSSSYSVLTQGNHTQTNPNGKFDHLAVKIPLKKYWGATLGIMPYSSVGYSYYEEGTLQKGNNEYDYTNSYVGTGGLNTLFLGTGISLNKNLSLGVNFKYIFGTLSYVKSVVYDDTNINSNYFYNSMYMGAPSLDLGFQYQTKFGKKSSAIIGGTFTKATSFLLKKEYNTKIIPDVDTVTVKKNYAFDLPNTIGIGVSYTYDDRLTIGFDYQYQAWSDAAYYGVKDSLADNTRYALGVEYLPTQFAKSYFNAIKYRFGIQYTDTYYKFSDGTIKNAGISLGLGLPLRGQKTSLNFTFEAGKLIVPKSCSIGENYYKVSLDFSLNELWFMKFKL